MPTVFSNFLSFFFSREISPAAWYFQLLLVKWNQISQVRYRCTKLRGTWILQLFYKENTRKLVMPVTLMHVILSLFGNLEKKGKEVIEHKLDAASERPSVPGLISWARSVLWVLNGCWLYQKVEIIQNFSWTACWTPTHLMSSVHPNQACSLSLHPMRYPLKRQQIN